MCGSTVLSLDCGSSLGFLHKLLALACCGRRHRVDPSGGTSTESEFGAPCLSGKPSVPSGPGGTTANSSFGAPCLAGKPAAPAGPGGTAAHASFGAPCLAGKPSAPAGPGGTAVHASFGAPCLACKPAGTGRCQLRIPVVGDSLHS